MAAAVGSSPLRKTQEQSFGVIFFSLFFGWLTEAACTVIFGWLTEVAVGAVNELFLQQSNFIGAVQNFSIYRPEIAVAL